MLPQFQLSLVVCSFKDIPPPLPRSCCPTSPLLAPFCSTCLAGSVPQAQNQLLFPSHLYSRSRPLHQPTPENLLWEELSYQPHQRLLNAQIRDTHSVCHFTACLSWHNYWAQIPPTWKCVPLPNHPKLSSLFQSVPAKHLWQPAGSRAVGPDCPNFLHDCCVLPFPTSGQKAPLSFPECPFLLGP